MFNVATLVRWTFILATLACGTISKAQTPPAYPESIDVYRAKMYCGEKGERRDTPECKEALNSSNGQNFCSDSAKDYKKALEEFGDACGEAGVASNGPEGKEGSNIACGHALVKCRCRFKQVSSDERSRLGCGSDDVVYDSSSSSGMAGGRGPDISAAKQRFGYCPAIASSGLKDFEDKLDRSEDRIKDLESKIPKMQTDADKGPQDSQKRMDELQDKLQENQDKFAEEAEKAQEGLAEEQKRLMDQIGQLQSQILQLEEQIGQLDLSRQEAGLKRDEAKKQVRLQCHGSAQAMASKLQADALELRRQGRLNLGGFNSLMKQVGMTDRQQWQRVAEKYYNWCLQSQATKDSMDSANVIYEAAVAQTRKAQNDTRKRIVLLQQQMRQIKDPASGCSPMAQTGPDGSPNESQMCSALRRAGQKQQRLAQAAQNKNDSLMRQMAGEQARSAQTQQRKDMDIAKANADLAAEKARRDKLQQYVDLANESGGDTGSDSKGEFKKANGKFNTFNSAAERLVSCQQDCSTRECKQAKKYLVDIMGYSDDQFSRPSMTVPQSTPPPTSDTTPPTTQPPTTTPPAPTRSGRGQR